jgi:hypothetical protein
MRRVRQTPAGPRIRASGRVVRSMFIADDEKTAQEYGKVGAHSPYRLACEFVFAS